MSRLSVGPVPYYSFPSHLSKLRAGSILAAAEPHVKFPWPSAEDAPGTPVQSELPGPKGPAPKQALFKFAA
jgi:hypothetical protein